jgi:hypothetical protein
MTKKSMFIESVTFFGNDVLIPIDRIKYITCGYYEKSYQIKIVSDDGEWGECFGENEDKMKARYEQIKKIIQAE